MTNDTPDPAAIANKLYKNTRLFSALACANGPQYPGVQVELAPKKFRLLHNMGLIKYYYPHNSAHKERAVVTTLGRQVIAYAQQTQRRK